MAGLGWLQGVPARQAGNKRVIVLERANGTQTHPASLREFHEQSGFHLRRAGVFPLDGFANEQRFRAAWEAVSIVRGVRYSLFTFGETDLPYFLILSGPEEDQAISIVRGNVKIARPMIITPDDRPEFEDFFSDSADNDLAQFILARTASFSNLKLRNQSGEKQFVSNSVEESIDKISRQLDLDDEDRVAILTAPAPLAGFAVLRYAAERIMQSVPDNIQQLREKGFLP